MQQQKWGTKPRGGEQLTTFGIMQEYSRGPSFLAGVSLFQFLLVGNPPGQQMTINVAHMQLAFVRDLVDGRVKLQKEDIRKALADGKPAEEVWFSLRMLPYTSLPHQLSMTPHQLCLLEQRT